MAEQNELTVDVQLGEVTDTLRQLISAAIDHHDVSIERSTTQCIDDVLGSRVVVLHQQMLTSYRSCRACKAPQRTPLTGRSADEMKETSSNLPPAAGEELGHDFDLSGSRDVIDDVIIRSAMGHFLLVGNWCQVSIQTVFEIFASKY